MKLVSLIGANRFADQGESQIAAQLPDASAVGHRHGECFGVVYDDAWRDLVPYWITACLRFELPCKDPL